MKWEGGEESQNVEDRRGDGSGDEGGGGGGGGIVGGLSSLHLGVGGTIVLLIVGYFLGINPLQLLNGNGGSPNGAPATPSVAKNDKTAHFIRTIVDYTEKVWTTEFRKLGKTYTPCHVVMYGGRTQTRGCGLASSEVGPFYCPADKTVYIDPAFYDLLEQRLGGSKADFSQAYVIAHEIGHHVQSLLGYGELVDRKRRELPEAEFNRWSVRLELQADYLAGVWAHYGNEEFHFIENGDAESAVKTATAIGDDTLQRNATGHLSPQKYTHGTSAQRVKWYKKGLETGDMSQLQVIFDLPYEQL